MKYKGTVNVTLELLSPRRENVKRNAFRLGQSLPAIITVLTEVFVIRCSRW